MRALTTREKLLTTAVAIVLAVVLVDKLILTPQTRRLQEARNELRAANESLAGLGAKLAGFRTVQQGVLNKEQELQALKRTLSFAGELTQVIHLLSNEARNHGLRLQYLRPQKTQVMSTRSGQPSSFRSSVMELGIRCRYKELGNFLTALEKERFYLRVADLQVERGQAQPPFLDVRLKLAIVVRS